VTVTHRWRWRPNERMYFCTRCRERCHRQGLGIWDEPCATVTKPVLPCPLNDAPHDCHYWGNAMERSHSNDACRGFTWATVSDDTDRPGGTVSPPGSAPRTREYSASAQHTTIGANVRTHHHECEGCKARTTTVVERDLKLDPADRASSSHTFVCPNCGQPSKEWPNRGSMAIDAQADTSKKPAPQKRTRTY
jgi:hypothetical protein